MVGASRSYQQRRDTARHSRKWSVNAVKLRGKVGVVGRKHALSLGLLNVDGFSPSALEDVKAAVRMKSLDVCVILETKRRYEEVGSDIGIPGYNVREIRRSDAADDRGGGGLAYYTKQSDGILFKEYLPPIADPALHYVRNERFWLTAESLVMKTAICGLYLGCQYGDDRFGIWNEGMFAVLQAEAATLRAQGYRIVYLGDFNSHIGSVPGQGVPNNHDDVNLNGERFLRFLEDGSFCHVNGIDRLTTGRWTRQRGGSKSILDYAVVSSEHLHTVQSLLVDEAGLLGGGSDHNFLVLVLDDVFVKKKRLLHFQPQRRRWNRLDNVDWAPFQAVVQEKLGRLSPEDFSVDQLASLVTSALLAAGEQCVGYHQPRRGTGQVQLPRAIVEELRLKRFLEQDWKSKVSGNVTTAADLIACEAAFMDQKTRVNDLLFAHKNRNRLKIKELCAGKTTLARRQFWSIVSTKVKQSTEISAVIEHASGILKCGVDEIKSEAELHLCRVFEGSFDEIPLDGHVAPVDQRGVDQFLGDHPYGVQPVPTLPSLDSSSDLGPDPKGWTNRDFAVSEVKGILKSLKGGKSAGWDTIPNEFLIHSPDVLASCLTVLFNKVKSGGLMPRGWNKGRITLIHKSGLREILLNYRPITVIISLSGLFSKLLNARLSEVVEAHHLLGESQNGFRKCRRMADNSFILDSILMKAKSDKKHLHLCYIDISKAYDSVNRSILWAKLASLGFGGEFLGCLRALYTNDCVDSVINGISTRPVFLRRGLRQGCSLSPLLFALYISEIGSDLSQSTEGYQLGGLTFSGLLFADDIVLISRTFRGLESLVSMVKARCDALKLVISPTKSNIVTPDDVDQLVLLNDRNEVSLSLLKVLSYKYLGTDTTLLMSSTGSKRQRRCVQTAKSYKFACFYVGRTGPDVIDTVLATWSNIAVPSMLSGCEVIPFSEATIESVERLQSQLAKHALDLPQSTPNLCAQTELGLKPFRMLLYQHQLSFYVRVMNLPPERWVRRVLSAHLDGTWDSPYMSYIASIRQKLDLLVAPPSIPFLKLHMNSWFLAHTNDSISDLSLPYVSPLTAFSRARYVCEHDGCSPLAQFKLSNAGLGNRAPRSGRQRTTICSLCAGALDEAHVAFVCPGLEAYRYDHTNVMVFITMCATRGILRRLAFKMYVRGLDWNGQKISTSLYLARGLVLKRILAEWLNRS